MITYVKITDGDFYDSNVCNDIERTAYYNFHKNKWTSLPNQLVKTVQFLCTPFELDLNNFGTFNPETDTIDKFSEEDLNIIKNLPDFSRFVTYTYSQDLYDNWRNCIDSISEVVLYAFRGKVYTKDLLHKFCGLYRSNSINQFLIEKLIDGLSKNYNIEIFNLQYYGDTPVIFKSENTYGNDLHRSYNIHITNYYGTPKLVEGLDMQNEGNLEYDLPCIKKCNDELFDGNKETYKYLKTMKRNIRELSNMLHCHSEYPLEKHEYMMEIDRSDFHYAHSIDMAAYKRNETAIKNFLNKIDDKFFKLCGKHILIKDKSEENENI